MKILANDGISEFGESLFKKSGLELLNNRVSQEHLIPFINDNEVEILLVKNATKVDKELINSCPSIKIIGKAGAEFNNIDVEYAEAKGIYVINTPKASAKAIAEMVFAHFFSLVRFLHDSNRNMPLEGDINFNLLKKSYQNASELSGKSIGLIGFDETAKETVKKSIALGMMPIVFSEEKISEKLTLEFFDGKTIDFEINTINNLGELIKNSDFISIHTPPKDGYLIDEAELKSMKDNVFIANIIYPGTINEVALIDYIEAKKVAGAALDVYETEPSPEIQILMNPNLSLTPNTAQQTIETQDRIWASLAHQIIELQLII